MKYTIIVPAFNAEKTIKKTLDSLMNLIFLDNDFEVICINDYSTDSTETIINSFDLKIKNLICINNQKNLGSGLSRNEGINRANGKFVLFVDADD